MHIHLEGILFNINNTPSHHDLANKPANSNSSQDCLTPYQRAAFFYMQKEWNKQLNRELINRKIPEKLCLWSGFLEEFQIVILILINITIYPVKEVPHTYSWSTLLDDCKYLKSYFAVLFITMKKRSRRHIVCHLALFIARRSHITGFKNKWLHQELFLTLLSLCWEGSPYHSLVSLLSLCW